MTRAFPISGSVEPDTAQDELEVEDESVYLHDYKAPVLGIKNGGVKCAYYLRPQATRLATAATPDTTPLGIMLKAAFGDEIAEAGSAITASSSATAVDITSGGAANIGAWHIFPVGDTNEVGRVSAIATNALTLDFGLSTTADTGEDMVNMHNWYPKPSSTETVYIQHAKANSSTTHKWAFRGCICESVEFDLARNALPKATFTFKSATWEFTTDDSVAVTVGTDTMGVPFAMKDAEMYLQSTATATRTQYPFLSASIKVNTGMRFAETLGGTEGRASAYRDGQRMFAEATVKTVSADAAAFNTWWTNRTALQLVIAVPSGTGSTKRWMVFDLPKCIIVGPPKTVKEAGMATTEFTLRSQMRSTSGATDLARTPFVLAIG